MPYYPPVSGGGSSNSAGLAGTGPFYLLHTSANSTLPFSKLISGGANITITTDTNAVFISATTGGGSGTPGGSDSQIQVNSQNAFAGFSNLRWISSSNSLDLNTAGRVRHGGVSEVDGIQPTGVTGLLWLDTSSNYVPSSINTSVFASSGAYFIVGSSESLLPSSKILMPGSSVTMNTDSTSIYINAITSAIITKGYEYYSQSTATTGLFSANRVRMYVASQINALALTATVIPINSACCVPFFTTKDITIDTMGFVATIAGSATSTSQLGIYTNSSDTVLYPFQSVSTSPLINNSLTTLTGYNPAITLSANNLYWFVIYLAKSARTLRTLAVGGVFPIYSMGTDLAAAPGTYIQCPITVANSSLSATMGTRGEIVNTAVPALAVRVSQ